MDFITGQQKISKKLEFHKKLENHRSGSIKHYVGSTGN